MQGGLGAGSANAVAALIGLEHELGRRLPAARAPAGWLRRSAPMYHCSCWVARWPGSGAGRRSIPFRIAHPYLALSRYPKAGVSTPQAFRDWDNLHSPAASALTTIAPSATIKELSRSIAAAFGEPHSSGVFSQGKTGPRIRFSRLSEPGSKTTLNRSSFLSIPFSVKSSAFLRAAPSTEDAAVYAGLSGSGSALFGLYRTPRAAEAALERLEQHGVTGLLTRTLPRSEYWRTMMMADGLSA